MSVHLDKATQPGPADRDERNAHFAVNERVHKSGRPRLAMQIADDLRARILSGELADGAELPPEDDLLRSYPVSRPTLRESMRVLEAEGLVVIRRGATGGAVVHRPSGELVTYGLGLVLASQHVRTTDLWEAISELEPACAAACARRPDRITAVVPTLQFLLGRAQEVVGDAAALAPLTLMLHSAVIDLCGNATLKVLTTSLNTMFRSQESRWTDDGSSFESLTVTDRIAALGYHHQVLEDITNGDDDQARATFKTLRAFLWESGAAGPDEEVIKGSIVRERFSNLHASRGSK